MAAGLAECVAVATLISMIEGLTLFTSGCVFGLAGRIRPGPTTTLVVAQTLRYGVFDGIKVAVAPLLTDQSDAEKG